MPALASGSNDDGDCSGDRGPEVEAAGAAADPFDEFGSPQRTSG